MNTDGRGYAGRHSRFAEFASRLRVLAAYIPLYLIGMLCCAGASAQTTRPAPPVGEELAAAEKLVHDLYKTELGAKSADGRRAAARKLIDEAAQSADHPAARFVLLRDARDLAAAAGDLPTALGAVDQLAAVFTIDAVEMKFSAMAAAAKASDSADLHQSVAMAALPLLDDAVAADNFDLAQRIAALAESSAPRSKKIALTSMVGDRVKEMKAVREERRAGAESLKRIAANEGSADDYLVAGRFLCFAKGDWTAGLPMLYRCPDVTFKAPAARELAGPADAAGWFALAGDWWDLAAKQNSPAAVRVQQHAAACYAKALPGLAGVNRALAEKRIDEVEIALLKSRRFEPGLVAELYRGTDFDTRVLTRIDPQLDFDWGREPPADGMPRSDYSARWRGRLRVPAAGSYTLILITGAGRLVLDGKELVNSDVLYRKRNGVQFELDLSAGLHELTLEIHVKSGQGRARLLWLRPGVVENEVIPVEAFFHSALDASAPPTTSPARTP